MSENLKIIREHYPLHVFFHRKDDVYGCIVQSSIGNKDKLLVLQSVSSELANGEFRDREEVLKRLRKSAIKIARKRFEDPDDPRVKEELGKWV